MTIRCDRDGVRLDAFLSEQDLGLSRSALQRLLEEGQILVSGRPVKKNYKTRSGDVIDGTFP